MSEAPADSVDRNTDTSASRSRRSAVWTIELLFSYLPALLGLLTQFALLALVYRHWVALEQVKNELREEKRIENAAKQLSDSAKEITVNLHNREEALVGKIEATNRSIETTKADLDRVRQELDAISLRNNLFFNPIAFYSYNQHKQTPLANQPDSPPNRGDQQPIASPAKDSAPPPKTDSQPPTNQIKSGTSAPDPKPPPPNPVQPAVPGVPPVGTSKE